MRPRDLVTGHYFGSLTFVFVLYIRSLTFTCDLYLHVNELVMYFMLVHWHRKYVFLIFV